MYVVGMPIRHLRRDTSKAPTYVGISLATPVRLQVASHFGTYVGKPQCRNPHYPVRGTTYIILPANASPHGVFPLTVIVPLNAAGIMLLNETREVMEDLEERASPFHMLRVSATVSSLHYICCTLIDLRSSGYDEAKRA